MLAAMFKMMFRATVLAAFVALFCFEGVCAQGPVPVLSVEALGKGAVALDGPWQFHLGDNMQWADAATDDATGQNGWEQLTADRPWGAQGHPSQEGYGWYRKHLHLSPAPGADPNFALLIPKIEDVYEIYWNGQLVGRLGKLPPHTVRFYTNPPQIFELGPVRDGVLAVRVWKAPLDSTDPGEKGGFEGTPLIGGPKAIAAIRAQDDYAWLLGHQFRFAQWLLYGLAAVFGFLLWLRNRAQRELLALAVYCGACVNLAVLSNLHFWGAFGLLVGLARLADVGLWYLLLYLFRLDEDPRVARITRVATVLLLSASTLDGIVEYVWGKGYFPTWGPGADGVLTMIQTIGELYVLVLIGLGLRRRLDGSRWFLAIAAALNQVLHDLIVGLSQGQRFTHWRFADRLRAPLFTLYGNPFALSTLTEIVLFAAIVYAVARTVRESARRQQVLEQEMDSARELQQVLIPETTPQLEGYTLTSAYLPAQEVGGDFFQVIPMEGERAGSALIVVGDVSGKGLRAAMAVSVVVGAVRTLVEVTDSPAEILSGLNRRLHGRLSGGFATCVVLRADRDGRLVVASAGHLAPLIDGAELELPGELPLGIVAEATYEEHEFELRPGQRLTLMTDGVVEAQDAAGELFGFERTAAGSGGHADEIARAAQEFGQQDDITVLTLALA